ncbi:SH3 domain-containing protein [Pantoea sp. Acro-805]|uniref:SH3 domain-containing protein n=1 Tax=Candidatus Pantoea formicae TaxID=2608355 RepID=A0ABX0QZL5_9GAMM|nr:SH3 domain-containing protein [Pantoea formicae]MDF7649593.1 SH3 domain-containing protein [Erwiniaceae bacterium L1_54_3]NIF00307.1 SH3 domain-containing protein [Pantoea formicae]
MEIKHSKAAFIAALFATAITAGCKAPPPTVTADTLETSTVNDVALVHMHIVQPPQQFKPINAAYRTLFPVSLINRPDYGGLRMETLESGATLQVLGEVENNWLAVATQDNGQLSGYIPFRAAVPSDRYSATVKAQAARPRRAQQQCIGVGEGDKACRKGNSSTWVIQ